jgi:hypothetical protein
VRFFTWCSVTFFQSEISPVTPKNPNFVRQFAFFPVNPIDFLEEPFFAKVGGHDGVLMLVISRYELVKEPEKLVDLLLGKVGIVTGVFNLKGKNVQAPASHDVWQRIQARVTDRDTHSIVPVLKQKFHKNVLAVETSLAPSTQSDPVNFFDHAFPSAVMCFCLFKVEDKIMLVDAFVYVCFARCDWSVLVTCKGCK